MVCIPSRTEGWLWLFQIQDDLDQGLPSAKPVPPVGAPKEDIVSALEANILAMIEADRKVTALKQLQVKPDVNFSLPCRASHLHNIHF